MATVVNRPESNVQAPDPVPERVLDEHGELVGSAPPPDAALLREMYRRLLIGRRFDVQATNLARQGRLAVYPSSRGQEACQVGAVLALRADDWLFPTYRDSVALVARGIDPVEVLSLFRGDRHCGYDPRARRTAPQCTPLATQAPHAVGLAHAARLSGDDVVALAFVGDGATSEGDFHEACNFAAVLNAPVVFVVQNNQYAISVPLSRQTKAPTLAHKAAGYGIPARRVDGNDVVAVHAAVADSVEAARAGKGPAFLEAVTYRIEPHTNADDAGRYRSDAEVRHWRERDPLKRLERHLASRGLLDDGFRTRADGEAESLAAVLRRRLGADPGLDPDGLFRDVFAEPTPQLREQSERLAAELALALDES